MAERTFQFDRQNGLAHIPNRFKNVAHDERRQLIEPSSFGFNTTARAIAGISCSRMHCQAARIDFDLGPSDNS
jgi:hypothetical protein